MSSRRSFLQNLILSLGAIPAGGLLSACHPGNSKKIYQGQILGASSALGHTIRDKVMQPPGVVKYIDYVIVGGGVSGLSAARQLHISGIDKFVLLELEKNPGGNAVSGSNEVSSYPWGAHYLPLPNNANTGLLEFLEEHEVITHFDENGIPHYNDYYLCHDPEERLYIHGEWQNGLIPHLGLPLKDLKEISGFLEQMEMLRSEVGKDGKYAFDIPVAKASNDPEFTMFDNVTMYDYLVDQGYTSPYLIWYINYCCKDDYGTSINQTSAWAGIHYFASRRAMAGNAESSAVLTWPEGNGFLTDKLRKGITDKILPNTMVYSIDPTDSHIFIDYMEAPAGNKVRLVAKKCIVATPQFINKHIVNNLPWRTADVYDKFTYSSWVVANLTVDVPPERRGRPLSWDNVLYNNDSLGYIHAKHQNLGRPTGKTVFTYYNALTNGNPKDERLSAYQKTHADWAQQIVQDFKQVYPDLPAAIHYIDIWVWGHAMIRPVPGFITGPARKSMQADFSNKLFFAHSDLSGISIFEEAFYHGVHAAQALINSNDNP